MKKSALLSFSAIIAFLISANCPAADNKHGGSPHASGLAAAQESLKSFTVADGLAVSLFAAEPMLRNPTDMDIDERGRVWVVEGVNYRSTFQPWGVIQPAGDRIVVLEDTDGDGLADKATIFYQGPEINAALGICVLGNKVIVCCSPNVYLFTDTDGDGKADKKELLFTGISGVDHDHGIHAFTFGPDGKLYFNFGNESKQLKDKDGHAIIDLAGNETSASGHPYRMGMAFRCNLDGSGVEVLAHNFRNPYELAVDSFGTLWQADNDDDGNRATRINYVMQYGSYGYADELTGAGWFERRSNLESDIPHQHWHQNDPGTIPNLLLTGAGAPAGMLVYEGNLLPEIFRDQMIVTDPGNRIVRAYPVKPDGAGYQASTVNLLSSSDAWFRPSDVCTAPDGSVYVADWNDAGVGGHGMADRDLATMTGRIYRLAPPGVKPTVPKLDLATAAGCIHALQSPNLSTRYLAWTALQAMPDHGEPELLKLLKSHADPRMRARALWLLTQNSAAKYVEPALRDKNPDLRITALRAAEEAKLEVIPFVKILLHDPSPQVRRECAIALRHNSSTEAPALWAALAQQYDGHDRWQLEALGLGADRQDETFLAAWLALVGDQWNTPAGRDIVWRSRSSAAPALLAKIIEDKNTPSEEWPRYFRAFDFINAPTKKPALLNLLLDAQKLPPGPAHDQISVEVLNRLKGQNLADDPDVKSALAQALEASRGTAEFVRLVQDFNLPDQTAGLLEVARRHPADEAGTRALGLILASPEADFILWNAIVRDTNSGPRLIEALGNTHDKKVVPLLAPLVVEPDFDSMLRRATVGALIQTQNGASLLLQLAQGDRLSPDIKLLAAMELSRVRWADIKTEAAKVLPLPQSRNGKDLPPLAELLKIKGDAARGANVFTRQEVGCINCHRVNERGVDLGPALSEIGSKLGRDALYEAILDPSAGIAFGYEAWRIELKSGDEVYGLIVSETTDELTVKDARAIPTHIKKQSIKTRHK